VKLEIFDVEHGQCALLTGDGEHMLIDAGHNSGTGWRPSLMLERRGIRHLDSLVITNEDQDHASDLPNVLRMATVGELYRNPTISGADILNLKGQDNCGDGIYALAWMLDQFTDSRGPRPYFGGLEVQTFWNDYPRHFTDENNLSLVVVLRWRDLAICFPGDMERRGWLRLLQDPAFRTAMSSVHILVASHHGRENGYFESLFRATGLRPQLVIISDCGIQHATQGTVALYRAWTTGVYLHGQRRCVLTTRHDGMITLTRGTQSWWINTAR
jgi:beta-lactamase superfamily II metal-dependent hydrolase